MFEAGLDQLPGTEHKRRSVPKGIKNTTEQRKKTADRGFVLKVQVFESGEVVFIRSWVPSISQCPAFVRDEELAMDKLCAWGT